MARDTVSPKIIAPIDERPALFQRASLREEGRLYRASLQQGDRELLQAMIAEHRALLSRRSAENRYPARYWGVTDDGETGRR